MLRRVAAAAALPDEIYVIDSKPKTFWSIRRHQVNVSSDLGQTYGWEQEFSALSRSLGSIVLAPRLVAPSNGRCMGLTSLFPTARSD